MFLRNIKVCKTLFICKWNTAPQVIIRSIISNNLILISSYQTIDSKTQDSRPCRDLHWKENDRFDVCHFGYFDLTNVSMINSN